MSFSLAVLKYINLRWLWCILPARFILVMVFIESISKIHNFGPHTEHSTNSFCCAKKLRRRASARGRQGEWGTGQVSLASCHLAQLNDANTWISGSKCALRNNFSLKIYEYFVWNLNGHSGDYILKSRENFSFDSLWNFVETVSILADMRRSANQGFCCWCWWTDKGLALTRSLLPLISNCCCCPVYRTNATWKPLGSAATTAAQSTAYIQSPLYRFWCALMLFDTVLRCVRVCMCVDDVRAKCILPMVLLHLLVLQTASFKVSQYSFDFVRVFLCNPFSYRQRSPSASFRCFSLEIIWFFLCRCAPSTPIKCITIWSVRRFLITFSLTQSFIHLPVAIPL